ncbi:uncharacterized protein [Henckelia pumila]|uniref:uncharacterized protein n=1 Tax=Henckelia pumila TaxID=405737 RepID=UPI003C6DC9A0
MAVNKMTKDLEVIVESEDGITFLAECECCGLKEECTEEYISRIRNSFSGKWLCGLCSEAVEEQVNRKPVAIEDAINTHTNFVQEFNGTIRHNPKLSLTWAMRNIAQRSCENRQKKKLA